MKKQIFYILIAVVAVLIIWRGIRINAPRIAKGVREHVTIFRGHSSGDSAVANIKAKVSKGNYPPRALGLSSQAKPPSDSWLLDADTDHDRFRRLEVVLRGADIHMLEIGLRFGALHRALAKDDLDLADYQIGQIVRAANIARLKQPGWNETQGMDYLGREQWLALDGAVKAHDGTSARQVFLNVRQTCISCHTAQNQDYLNQSEVFEMTADFPQLQVTRAQQ